MDGTWRPPTQRTGSLRDALKGTAPLAYGCQNESPAGILLQVPCTAAHRFEYVGTWTAPDVPYADVDRDEDQIHSRCRRVIAGYVKVPVDRLLPYRSGTLYVLPSEEAWDRGDREIRCFLWSSDRALKRSVKGGGTRALPVR